MKTNASIVACGLIVSALCTSAFAVDSKALQEEAQKLLKAKSYSAAAEKFLVAAGAEEKTPRRLHWGFNQSVEFLSRQKGTNNLVQAEALAEKALLTPGLSMDSRVRVEQLRLGFLPKLGRKNEAVALANDLLDAKIDVAKTAQLGAEASCYGTKGRDAWFNYLDRILANPARYGLAGEQLKTMIKVYSGDNGGWGGNIIDRPRLEKAEKYAEKYGFGKMTPNRLKEMREMDEKFPLPESELHIPADLSSFGFDPNRKVVHAKDFGWNRDDATLCLSNALNCGASTVIIDDMGSPWYTRPLKITKDKGSNMQVVFKKGVKLHAVTKPFFQRGDLFSLQSASNVVFIGEGELGKDVYIGQFPDRASRFASGQNYGGCCFSGRGYNVLVKNLWVANNLDDGFCMCGSYHYIVDCILDNNYRQGLSVVWSDHGVYKNVTFCRTVGGEPHNGFDLEPVYETYSSPWHYFLDCKFFDNAAGNVVMSTSTFAPTTLYFRNCDFAAGRYRNFSVLARLGIYTGPIVEAPSKILLENCRLDGYDDSPVLFYNSMIFNMTFKDCVFTDRGHLDPTRKPNMSPILLGLDRGYWDGFYPKAGKVNFENCTFNGWTNRQLIAVADHNGKVGVNTFRGVVNHNGKKVDLSRFSYLPAERSLKDAEDPDLKDLSFNLQPSTSNLQPPTIAFSFGHAWYHPMPSYTYFVKGEAGKSATLAFEGVGKYEAWTFTLRSPSGKETDLGKLKPGRNDLKLTFDETGVYAVSGSFKGDGSEHEPTYKFLGATGTPVAYGAQSRGVGRMLKITTAAEKPRAVGYFEVTGGKHVNIKISGGGLEILDETGKSKIKLDDGDYFGTKTFTLVPSKDAVWSFRALTPSVEFRFFAPYVGVFAETPEALPTVKKNLAFAKVEPIPAPELKDEPMLPLPAALKDEVAKLAAERLAWARLGNEAKRLEDAQKALADLKKTATGDADKRQVDDVARTVARFTHHAKVEATAQKESDEERTMAALCGKYGVLKAPEHMWQFKTIDGFFDYPDARALRFLYNEIIRRMK